MPGAVPQTSTQALTSATLPYVEAIAKRGVEEAMRRFGDSIMHTHFPPPGSPANPIEGGYMANAWMRLRHPDYDELRKICDTVGRMIKIRAR